MRQCLQRVTWSHLLALFLVGCSRDPVAGSSSTERSSSAGPPATSTAAADTPPTHALPPSDRVFVMQLWNTDIDHILGADGDQLWAAERTREGGSRVLWRGRGPGAVQRVIVGDFGQGRHLYVARGASLDFRDAPLVLLALDPVTGEGTELWRHTSDRNDSAHLSISDVDQDGRADLAFAYFASKYEVRTRHLRADGRVIEGPAVRMATCRTFADVDGDGKTDEVVGRMYGDTSAEPGDLRVHFGEGRSVVVPTEKGVRALLAVPDARNRSAIYFADGWVAAYGKDAKAQLKRARWVSGRFEVDTIGRSADEFTFSELASVESFGLSQPCIAAQGNLRLTLFEPTSDLPWHARSIASTGRALNTAFSRDAQNRLTLYVPARNGTRALIVPPNAPPQAPQ